ncbi:hypothetical protein O4H26_08320 [Aequorivita viscosa]|nr:hypothetical protein [Aequorivita viscosa]
MNKTRIALLFSIFVFGISGEITAQVYGYYVAYTQGHHYWQSDAREGKPPNLLPKKYIAYLSPIFETATKEEGRKKTDEFMHKFNEKIKAYCVIDRWGNEHYNSFYALSENRNEIEKRIEEHMSYLNGKNYTIEKEKSSVASDVFKEYASFQNLDIDGMKISGHLTLKGMFVFMGYPYIVAEYEDLTITSITYKNETYSQGFNAAKKYLSLPYKTKEKPLIDVVCSVWTPKIKNPKHLKKEHYKIFEYPINKLASITDHYDNNEADSYFKSFNAEEERDSYYWTRSLFKHPKQDVLRELTAIEVISISLTTKQELEKKLKTYLYEKDRDFWGNKKENTKEKTSEKSDDFWD